MAAVTAIAVLAALAAIPTASSKPSSGDQRLQRALDHLVEIRGGPPGASAVLRRGKRERFITAGVADVESERPFSPRKHMRIARTSKAFSGAVALSLVDRGVLSFDDTIGSRLPTLPAAWGAVTLRQLLQHTGGLPTFTKAPDYLAYFAEHLHDTISHQTLIDFVTDQPLDFPPGSSYHYSNTDNLVIALMAEAATSRSYDELLSELVFDPLGLGRTGLPGPGAADPRL